MDMVKIGFLTERQVKVLMLKIKGCSFREIARLIGVSHQTIALTYRKAVKNIARARETLLFYNVLTARLIIELKPGIKLVEIPKIVVEEADKSNIRVKADFTLLYKLIRYRARNCIEGRSIVKPIYILILEDGSIEVYPRVELERVMSVVNMLRNEFDRV